ncbi:MAG: hypothetical protein ABIH25_00560 [Candidatus Woesearchaeota archaeon]
MKNRGMLLVLFIVFGLFISGCVFGPGGSEETNIGGVDMKIMEGRPPTDFIIENQNFDIAIQLTNNIPRAVNNVEVCVEDLPSDIYGGIQGNPCKTVSLLAATEFEGAVDPYVQERPVEFEAEPYINLKNSGVKDTNFLVTLTYSLVSSSRTNVCLFRDISVVPEDFDCSVKTTYLGNEINSDFAPLIVDQIESQIVPDGDQNRIVLDIYFRKDTTGLVIDLNTKKPRFGVDVSFTNTESDFTCGPLTEDDKIDMSDITKKIRCNSLFDLTSPYYTDSLNIDMDYTYRVSVPIRDVKLEPLA